LKIKSYLPFAGVMLLFACAPTLKTPHWNHPQASEVEIVSLSYLNGGIGKVEVIVRNRSNTGYCITNQIYSGKPSTALAADLIDAGGNVIDDDYPGGVVPPGADITMTMVAPGTSKQFTLNYNGLYNSSNASRGKKLKFRVVLPVQQCADENTLNVDGRILLVSEFQEVTLPENK